MKRIKCNAKGLFETLFDKSSISVHINRSSLELTRLPDYSFFLDEDIFCSIRVWTSRVLFYKDKENKIMIPINTIIKRLKYLEDEYLFHCDV